MTLIRPDQSQRLEGSPELSLEQTILRDLGDIKESQTFMRVVLLGGVYRDVPYDGKLPAQDAMIKLQAEHIAICVTRLKILEDDKLERDSSMRTTKWLCGIFATAGATAATLIVNLITKH